MPLPDWTRRVFRLRRLPDDIATPDAVARLLGRLLALPTDHIIVYSVTTSPYIYEVPSRTATLQLKTMPECFQSTSNSDEWTLPAVAGCAPAVMILDTHFDGLTVLHDPEHGIHVSDCIAISGLGSHPFGSWQPHGGNKSFMWLRDAAPDSLQGARTLIYGYDSKLADSTSFQSVADIARKFILHLKSGGWNRPSSKPIVFLAHSLGGLVLMEAIIQIAESRDQRISSILDHIRGAIMFGVPTLGMDQAHLMAMVEGQPNESLIQDLSRDGGNDYIRTLHGRFDGLSFLKRAPLVWAYETKQSETVSQLPDGSWKKSGEFKVLVHPNSATSRQYGKGRTSDLIPINKDHSGMVKFHRSDGDLAIIMTSIRELCSAVELAVGQTVSERDNQCLADDGEISRGSASLSTKHREAGFCPALIKLGEALEALDGLQNEIHSGELDFRVISIDSPFEDTFTWIFDLPIFVDWLQGGSGLFWIYGKPGSGKSTLMKLIFQSNSTQKLIHTWLGSALEIFAGFFFHYRGSAVQKSIEGVLRSLAVQILAPLRKSYIDHQQPTWKKYDEANSELFTLDRLLPSLESDLSHIKDALDDIRKTLSSLVRSTTPDASKMAGNSDIPQEGDPSGTVMKKTTSATEMPGQRSMSQDYIQATIATLTEQRKVFLADEALLKEKLLTIRHRIKTVVSTLKELEKTTQPVVKTPEFCFLFDIAVQFRDSKAWQTMIPRLERLLRHLLHQEVIAIDLVLFLDALDEFDGHDDTIGRFMKDLLKIPPTSKTRVKVCVSSRPTPGLKSHFGSYPGFAIHDHTKHDIQEYAAKSVPLALDTYKPDQLLQQLVPSIIDRANGVFLWVTLAIKELQVRVKEATDVLSMDALEKILYQLPDDLQTFYELIVERISKPNRLWTYALLELLIRKTGPPFTAREIHNAVSVSYCKTFDEALEVLDNLDPPGPENDENFNFQLEASVRDKIHAWSGGLVEVKVEWQNRIARPQFMHQTVLEFATGPWFKKVVVGDHLAAMLNENGHSFYAKYWIAKRSLMGKRSTAEQHFGEGSIRQQHLASYTKMKRASAYFRSDAQIKSVWGWIYKGNRDPASGVYIGLPEIAYHILQSELTTGTSQYGFLSTVRVEELKLVDSDLDTDGYHTPTYLLLLFIVSFSLTLSLREWVGDNSRLKALSRPQINRWPLLSSLFFFPPSGIVQPGSFGTAQLLLDSGYDLAHDPDFFPRVLAELWARRSPKEEDEATRSTVLGVVPASTALKLAVLALEHGQDPNVLLTFFSRIGLEFCQALHVATPTLARELIRHGADATLESSDGSRPIHWIFHHPEEFEGEGELDFSQRYEMCSILVEAGGVTNGMRPLQGVERCLADFENRGYDIRLIHQKLAEAGMMDTESAVAPPILVRDHVSEAGSVVEKKQARWRPWAQNLELQHQAVKGVGSLKEQVKNLPDSSGGSASTSSVKGGNSARLLARLRLGDGKRI